MVEKFEYIDRLREYMKERVTDFVDRMGDSTPDELREMTRARLIYNLTDFATSILRGTESNAIQSACYHLTTSIRWAKQHPNEGKHKGV